MRKCIKCGETKEISCFYPHKRSPNGFRSQCKDCCKTQINKQRESNPDKYREYELKRLYGISISEYNVLFQKQNGKCAICKIDHIKLKKRLEVDHNHQTGKVRGLLCGNCNKTLGKINDSISIVQNMLSYLQNN